MSTAAQQFSSPPPVDRKFIYVVDDELMIAEVVKIILDLEGYTPKVFMDPEEALRALLDENPKPALLLTDFL